MLAKNPLLLSWSALLIALGIDISKTANYKEGQLTRFVSLEYKSDLRRDGSDYLSKNAEQEVSVKLGLDYQQDDIRKIILRRRRIILLGSNRKC
jgi:hypothetical protein